MSKESAMAVATGAPAVTPQATEVPANVETKTAGEPQATDPNVQALLKKEVRLVREQEEFKRQQLEWKEKLERADRLLARDKEFDETKKKDTVAALKMLGFNDTEIFNAVAATAPQEKTPEEKAEEVARRVLKENNDALEAKAKEAEAQKNKQVIENFQKSIGQAIKASPDKYEFCNFNGEAAEELIYLTVEETLKESKGTKLLTVAEAADIVEAHYEEQAKKLTSLKKMTPAQAAAVVKEELKKETVLVPKVGGEMPKPKTLTNKVTVTSTTNQRAETQSEKRERLAQVLRTGDTALLRR